MSETKGAPIAVQPATGEVVYFAPEVLIDNRALPERLREPAEIRDRIQSILPGWMSGPEYDYIDRAAEMAAYMEGTGVVPMRKSVSIKYVPEQ
jgi:hypothetical protein